MTAPSKEQIKAMADRTEARARGKTTAEEFVATAIGEGELNAEIKKLAALPIGVYEAKRAAEAKRLGMRVGIVDFLVKAERDKASKKQKDFLPHWNVERWPEPVDGTTLLEELRNYFTRHAALPKHADVVLALWPLHTWVFDCFDITPYLVITSPTRRCGKSLLLTILSWMCCRAKKNDSMSKAAIYRSVESEQPTLLLDETGWVVDQKDERQGILCGGFERNGFVEVCEGDGANITVRRYSTYCPKAFGIIGKLTATLMDRAIEIAMHRKTKRDSVERLGRRDNADYSRLRQQCLRWANDNREALAAIEPKAPDGLNDRALDIWEPLLAIAEHVGGDWPKLVAEAAIALSGGEAASEERSVELLADIRATFDASGLDEITTKALIAALCADEERPWATYNKGKPISDRQVAKLLKQFPILSEDVYPPRERHAKGYKQVRFLDAFERYLTPATPALPEMGGTQACERVNADEMGTTRGFSIRVESNLHGCEKSEKPTSHAGLHAYTDKNPETPREGPSDRPNGGNRAGRFRFDVEELRVPEAATPEDDELTIPACLDRRHEFCAQCGRPGGTEWDYLGFKVRLHSDCERPWIEAYEASRNSAMACTEALS
jgi:hypothetical protein